MEIAGPNRNEVYFTHDDCGTLNAEHGTRNAEQKKRQPVCIRLTLFFLVVGFIVVLLRLPCSYPVHLLFSSYQSLLASYYRNYN